MLAWDQCITNHATSYSRSEDTNEVRNKTLHTELTKNVLRNTTHRALENASWPIPSAVQLVWQIFRKPLVLSRPVPFDKMLNKSRASSSLSSCLSMTFSGETTESELESEPSTRASGSYDEEAVLHFVRDLCEEQVATSKQNDNYGEADLAPPQSASSTESSFVFNESLQPSTCPRARMKRRLSN